jgi:hypothetical protein
VTSEKVCKYVNETAKLLEAEGLGEKHAKAGVIELVKGKDGV